MTMHKIVFYSPIITPRLRYTAMHMMSMLPGADVVFSSNRDEALSASIPVINYSPFSMGGALNVLPDGLLEEKGVRNIDVKPATTGKGTVLFESKGGDDIGFDIFAASFYMLSRYEEYIPSGDDLHGRFPWKNSMVSRYGLTAEPLVDQWAVMLREALVRKYSAVSFPEREFRFIPTIDVDVPWAYKNRGIWRTVGGFGRSALTGGFEDLKMRYRVLFRGVHDPFDTYGFIRETHRSCGVPPVFFFSARGYGKYDKSVSPFNPEYRGLVRELSAAFDWGIHPSYRSYGDPGRLKKEADMLAAITGVHPVRSRNHYLRFSFPDSCRILEAAGIKEDYTLGWAEMTGFRAGTCTPFRFYDVERDEMRSLVLYPFQIMDGTLCDYMKMEPEQAAAHASEIVAKVRRAGGTLVTLWHNESLSETGRWKNWKNVYLELIRKATR